MSSDGDFANKSTAPLKVSAEALTAASSVSTDETSRLTGEAKATTARAREVRTAVNFIVGE